MRSKGLSSKLFKGIAEGIYRDRGRRTNWGILSRRKIADPTLTEIMPNEINSCGQTRKISLSETLKWGGSREK